jgi:hypothetical protein
VASVTCRSAATAAKLAGLYRRCTATVKLAEHRGFAVVLQRDTLITTLLHGVSLVSAARPTLIMLHPRALFEIAGLKASF